MNKTSDTKDFFNALNPAVGLIISLIVIGIYNFLFFNKYFPMSEGWFSVIADRMSKGEVPYRDFHFFIPPLYPLVLEKFIQLFGNNFIFLRVFGIGIILSMTVVLFFLFVRIFPLYIASAATILSIVYYQSNVSHITYDFLQFMTLFGLISTYCLCRFIESDKRYHITRSMAYIFIAGFFGSCAFLMKQSNGLVIVFFLFVALSSCLYAGNSSMRKSFAYLFVFMSGVMLPLLLTVLWLYKVGAFSLFLKQVFIGASESKGSPAAIAFAWIPRLFTIENIEALCTVSFVLLLLGYLNIFSGERSYDDQHPSEGSKIYILFWTVFFLSLMAILGPYWNTALSKRILSMYVLQWLYYYAFIAVPTIFVFILFAAFVFRISIRKDINYDYFIMTTMAIGFALGTATSAAVADAGMIIALGLLFGLLWYSSSFFQLGKILCFLLLAVMISFMASKKYTQPYYWWSLTQGDIRNAEYSSDVKFLAGVRLEKETAEMYSEVVSLVDRYAKPTDTIYTFPNNPVFYLLTERYPRTFALVNWFDVMPDNVAENDASNLLQSPPSIILWLDMPDFVWLQHEKMFRQGRQSGQRRIAEIIDRLTIKEHKYILVKSYRVPDNCTLKIWRRRTI